MRIYEKKLYGRRNPSYRDVKVTEPLKTTILGSNVKNPAFLEWLLFDKDI